VAEAVSNMMASLPNLGSSSFRQLTSHLVERLEVIVCFLAILEMYKQGYVDILQADRFGDIEVQWTGEGPESANDIIEIDSYEG
jgi:segregation and condensation protein A